MDRHPAHVADPPGVVTTTLLGVRGAEFEAVVTTESVSELMYLTDQALSTEFEKVTVEDRVNPVPVITRESVPCWPRAVGLTVAIVGSGSDVTVRHPVHFAEPPSGLSTAML